jgi:hypothetical protein
MTLSRVVSLNIERSPISLALLLTAIHLGWMFEPLQEVSLFVILCHFVISFFECSISAYLIDRILNVISIAYNFVYWRAGKVNLG